MTLSQMRFKSFVFPHNPKIYSIEFRRTVAAHKLPAGVAALQNLGRSYRVMKGEGEFFGPDAYKTFQRLANVFYEETSGQLIHPLWVTSNAFLVKLELMQSPEPEYLRYSFEFWEDAYPLATAIKTAQTAPFYHTVASGETVYTIAAKYYTTASVLLKLNPTVKNPIILKAGQKLRVK